MNFLSVFKNLKVKVSELYTQLKLNLLEQATGRPRSLSIIDSLTLALYWKTQNVGTKIALWNDFKPSCTYKTFVVTINRFALIALLILKFIMRMNQKASHLIKHTDSTDIPVCLNKNTKKHTTMRGLASWGHSGKGFYYGLKLHITTDYLGRLLNVSFTPGNGSERKEFLKLNKEMNGLFVTDAGYISKELADTFNTDKRIIFAKPLKSMKKLIAEWQYNLYNTRMRVERTFRSLKMFRGLQTSLPRSIDGYLGNYVYALLAHVIA